MMTLAIVKPNQAISAFHPLGIDKWAISYN